MNKDKYKVENMKDLAPDITRQRLLIEGFYQTDIKKEIIKAYFRNITKRLKLKTYGKAIIYSPKSLGKRENQGFDAFIPLIDSGISLYVWSHQKFLSVVIYTCKTFSKKTAVKFTKSFFKMKKLESSSF